MKQLSFIFLFFASIFSIACNNSATDKISSDTQYPVLNQPSPELNQTNNTAQPVAQLNPAHGEPGHRCDIAVGAPLNGTSASTTSGSQSLNTSLPAIPTTLTQQPVLQTNASGINPEHGKPGHRCDIAVGAPLNSTPTSATTSTTSPSIVSTPVTVNQNANESKTAPGMNPKHGEPGHRCDIAVGAPLNDKATQSPLPPPAPSLPLIPVKQDSSKN